MVVAMKAAGSKELYMDKVVLIPASMEVDICKAGQPWGWGVCPCAPGFFFHSSLKTEHETVQTSTTYVYLCMTL